ncbi:MAG: ABC-2 transporter permease [Clostridia bacterium]|nr:ABC-2 transporter permease [Clostridia bacterium]
MSAVYKRELRAYMNNVYGWLFMAILLLAVGFMMFLDNLRSGYPYFEYALSDSQYALLLLIPILCMRSMAEDKRNKTDMFYLSLPMKTSSVVLGKYFAMLTIYAIPCAVLCLYPLVLSAFGTLNYATAYVSILFYLLMGAALIAVCQFLSSLTDNLVIAAVLGVLATALLLFSPLLASFLPVTALVSFVCFVVLALLLAGVAFLTTHNLNVTAITGAAAVVPLSVVYILARDSFKGLFPALVEFLSPFMHVSTFCQYGTFSIQSVVLLLSYPVLFVFLTVQSADKKRWD